MGHQVMCEGDPTVHLGGTVTKKVPCEVYSRIVGYFRPIRNWNKGAQQMHRERRMYQTPAAGEGESPQTTGYVKR